MRLFHALVFEQYMEDAGFAALYKANEAWTLLLLRADTLKFFCVADGVSGVSPVLTMSLKGSPTAEFGNDEGTKTLFNGVTLNSGTNVLTATYSPLDTTYPAPGYLFLTAFLNGTTPKAHVRLWVCGRGEQALAMNAPATPAFAAQYAAARALDEEDKLLIRKRVSRPGAGVVIPPPDLFDPSIKWEQ